MCDNTTLESKWDKNIKYIIINCRGALPCVLCVLDIQKKRLLYSERKKRILSQLSEYTRSVYVAYARLMYSYHTYLLSLLLSLFFIFDRAIVIIEIQVNKLRFDQKIKIERETENHHLPNKQCICLAIHSI